MTLSLYIARRFVWMFLRVFFVFFGILMLIDMLDQLRRFSGKGVGLTQALHLSAMNVPESLYRILPLIMILSAIALFLGLSRSSELVVVRAAGRSGLRFLLTPVTVSLAIGAIAVANGHALDCARYSGGRYRGLETPEARSRIGRAGYC